MPGTVDPFSIATFERDGQSIPVVVAGGRAHDLRTVLPDLIRTTDLFSQWDANLDEIARYLADHPVGDDAGIDPSALRPLPPVQPVGAVIAAGANYREHVLQLSVAHKLGRSDATDEELRVEAAQEIDERARVGHPYVWAGLSSAVSGARDDIHLPEVGENVDWELELGVVISRPGFGISLEEAGDYIAGYTICNDLSIRSLIPRRDVAMMGTDWFRSKNAPGFYPTGPYLTPARFIDDVSELRIQLWVNGEIKQDATVDDLLFDVPQLISYVSAHVPLEAGDMLITGSPAGNGSHFGRFLQAGDIVEATITGLGTQRNAVIGRTGQLPPWYAQGNRTAP
ncbi:fumarylacetoacetate hydrolase family protein [Microbacterium pumilum]|uniref:Fumarylacetoacetate hydrolase family protein n=1 Tax=Microbacterium pumilum TaxID=344165 RepID=A0ABP5EH70_9MICO